MRCSAMHVSATLTEELLMKSSWQLLRLRLQKLQKMQQEGSKAHLA